MRKQKCSHLWELTNIANGLIVMKKCFHCAKISTCFIFYDKPPLEPCHEETHFWNFVESDPAFHFDLKCKKCDTLVKLDELVALMLCTGCDQTCQVDILRRKLEPKNTHVYIALGCRPIDERPQLPKEKIAIIEDFLSQQCKPSKSKIKLVSHEMIKSIESCYAKIIQNAETLFMAPSQQS